MPGLAAGPLDSAGGGRGDRRRGHSDYVIIKRQIIRLYPGPGVHRCGVAGGFGPAAASTECDSDPADFQAESIGVRLYPTLH